MEFFDSLFGTGTGGSGGVLDWFTKPLDPENPTAGLNRLGALGAAFKDFGAAQDGHPGTALDSFMRAQRDTSTTAKEAPSAGMSPLGVLGAAFKEIGAQQAQNAPTPGHFDKLQRSVAPAMPRADYWNQDARNAALYGPLRAGQQIGSPYSDFLRHLTG